MKSSECRERKKNLKLETGNEIPSGCSGSTKIIIKCEVSCDSSQRSFQLFFLFHFSLPTRPRRSSVKCCLLRRTKQRQESKKMINYYNFIITLFWLSCALFSMFAWVWCVRLRVFSALSYVPCACCSLQTSFFWISHRLSLSRFDDIMLYLKLYSRVNKQI